LESSVASEDAAAISENPITAAQVSPVDFVRRKRIHCMLLFRAFRYKAANGCSLGVLPSGAHEIGRSIHSAETSCLAGSDLPAIRIRRTRNRGCWSRVTNQRGIVPEGLALCRGTSGQRERPRAIRSGIRCEHWPPTKPTHACKTSPNTRPIKVNRHRATMRVPKRRRTTRRASCGLPRLLVPLSWPAPPGRPGGWEPLRSGRTPS